MIRFLHLSDLHIHTGAKKNAELAKRLRYIRENYPYHDLIVTGDVTDDGSQKQYQAAMYMLPKNNSHVCPGNHDYGFAGNLYEKKRAKRFDQYLPQSRKYMGLWARPVVDVVSKGDTRVVLVGLNSNLKTHNPLDFACGKIGLVQRYLLKRTLHQARRKYPNCVRIVYFHHHPFDRGPWTGMKDAKKLMDVLMDCELVLFGHKHVAFQWFNMAAAGKLSECYYVTEIVVNDVLGDKITMRQVPVV